MFLSTTCWLAAAAFLQTAAPAMRPNVILIVADDLGAHDLGCYGSKFHRTPELDRLAREGVRFTQAYAACPVCSPTRAAIMTGKAPARLQLTDWLPGRPDRPDQALNRPALRQELPLAEVTIAEVFRDGGYLTGHIGKWHLGGDGFGPLQQGFHSNIAGDHTGTPLSYFAPFVKNGRVMPGLEEAPAGEYLTDRLYREAERFVERHREQPFFLYFPHYAVHTPMKAPAELVQQFPADTPFAGQQNNPTYAAMLLAVDQGLGRLRAKLAELRLADRTLIVFTSDNGGLATTEGPQTPATSNAPLREGKGWLYEGGIRVPLILSGAGVIDPGRTSDEIIVSHDLLPTLCSLCGLTSPAGVDGVDLSAVVRGAPIERPRPLYWHYPHYSNQGGRPGAAIRDGQFKLIEFYETGRRELFDLAADPREGRNLSAEKPDVVERLAAQLAQWRTEVGAQMMTPNPGYRPHLQQDSGRITLPAKTAHVQGLMLRYEPLPHKNTLGYWVRVEDTASWEFEVVRPGKYRVEALVGCGNGSGGSTVEFRFGDQVLTLVVPVTGGFQQFVPQDLGEVTFAAPGRHTLVVAPKTKPGPAVMDLRQMVLTPVP
ncbi:MAG: sulfatase-like hydrolase/transferase [Planctomycetaceae bacterium]|nr:sulfatase-like hydrolase/transferase [Planctomycetaceae bacterium]